MIPFLVLVVSLQEPTSWGLPHAGKALNQNELTCFSDCVLVTIDEVTLAESVRDVASPVGTLQASCRTQMARIARSNFGLDGSVTLVFTPHFPQAQPASPPGWIDLPLAPGRYFVMGRRSSSGSLVVYPGTVGYGFRDESVQPPVPFLKLPSQSDREFAVFHILPTTQTTLAANSSRPGSVLRNVVSALTRCEGLGFAETVSLLLRTNHEAFADWREAAKQAAADLAHHAQASRGNRRALALLAAYKMGSSAKQVNLEPELFTALVTASNEDETFWTSSLAQQAMALIQPVSFPSPEERAILLGVGRQASILAMIASAHHEPVRQTLVRFLSSGYSSSMNPAIVQALQAVEGEPESAVALLERIAEWRQEPDRKPSARFYSSGALIAYWIQKLGR